MAKVFVNITLDKQRRIRLGFMALEALESVEGNGLEALKRMNHNMSVRLIRNILWAGLLEDDPEITPEQVSKILNDFDLGEVLEKLLEAVNGALDRKNEPTGEEKTNPEQEPQESTPPSKS